MSFSQPTALNFQAVHWLVFPSIRNSTLGHALRDISSQQSFTELEKDDVVLYQPR